MRLVKRFPLFLVLLSTLAIAQSPCRRRPAVVPYIAGQQQVTVSVAASEVKNLTNFPKMLAAVPAGHAYIIIRAEIEYLPGTIAYTDPAGTFLAVQLNDQFANLADGQLGQMPAAGFLTSTAGQISELSIKNSAGYEQVSVASMDGAAIVLTTNGNGDVATGNGTLKVTVTYDDLLL